MRYATSTRSAHALILRPLPGTAGQHRTPARFRARSQRHLRREPLRTARLLSHGLAALIVLGIVVMVGVLILADDRLPSTGSTRDPRTPLTSTDVFPDQASLFRVSQARVEADCPLAVSGGLRSLLQGYGCTQAVRADLTVPYAPHQVTAGVLNLPDAQSAAAVSELIRAQVETNDGGFTSLTGAETPLGTPVVWRTLDHYLLYCVIVSPGGEPLTNDDPSVARIMTEVLETHLPQSLTSPAT
ncbi:hypothetical protein ACQP2E_03010 [Actinoplanes sp. CA-015351]|uniref:hypothetical protein n=1 Tax=Actinoplanes sp. CA-015351 TaxID=3239897 RepID=UPI003D989DFE